MSYMHLQQRLMLAIGFVIHTCMQNLHSHQAQSNDYATDLIIVCRTVIVCDDYAGALKDY